MANTLWYPSYVYDKNEDITRENKRLYDLKQDALEKRCLEIEPDYHKKNLLERSKIREEAEKDLVW